MSAPFDPAAWLAAFVEAGGSYALTADGKLWLGVAGIRTDIASHTFHLIGHPERMEALRELVRDRRLIA